MVQHVYKWHYVLHIQLLNNVILLMELMVNVFILLNHQNVKL